MYILGVRRVRRSMPCAVARVRVPRRNVQPLALYIHGGTYWRCALLDVGSLSDITSNAHAHYESLAYMYGMK